MSKNVIILGAGFSHAAQIPLLKGFVTCMMDLADRRHFRGDDLRSVEVESIKRALEVRKGLDHFHGRIRFDDRNIEDLLSILEFNALAGRPLAKKQQNDFNHAISMTIEICCALLDPRPGVRGKSQTPEPFTGPAVYRDFWKGVFDWSQKNGDEFPTIVSLNYDLVLERSLLQVVNGPGIFERGSKTNPFHYSGLRVSYGHQFREEATFKTDWVTWDDSFHGSPPALGPQTQESDIADRDRIASIQICKLHGSLNFPKKKQGPTEMTGIQTVLDDPDITPPISNKTLGKAAGAWVNALNAIREARNVVIVGYSLPQTDIYMQYFFKSAFGPNSELRKIVVFDPVLHRDSPQAAEMKGRYLTCFSEQVGSLIEFQPPVTIAGVQPGTTDHFVYHLQDNEKTELLY